MKKYFLKMTPKLFMRKVIELYRKARIPHFFHPKIKRGKSRSISGLSEDLLAFFLSVNLIGDYDFFVDQQITLEGESNSIRPDVILCKDKKIDNIIDVKTDLGWKRDKFGDFCIELNEKVQERKSKKVSVRLLKETGLESEKTEIETTKNLSYHIVIISDRNISEDQLKRNLEKINDAKLENIDVYILSSKIHPNHYGMTVDKVLDAMVINNTEFIRLLENLTEVK